MTKGHVSIPTYSPHKNPLVRLLCAAFGVAVLAGCGQSLAAGDVSNDSGRPVAQAEQLPADSPRAPAGNADRSGAATSGSSSGGSGGPAAPPAVSAARQQVVAVAVAQYVASQAGTRLITARVATESTAVSDVDAEVVSGGHRVRLAMLVSRVHGKWRVVSAREVRLGGVG